MRVVLNYLPATGARTGVGHYTAELLRCLRTQATDEDQIEPFPGSWGQRAHSLWLRCRRDGQMASANAQTSSTPSTRLNLRQKLIHAVRNGGRSVRGLLFRYLCRSRKYDLYHEPNFIPLRSECPTVVTIHDLSVLLYPEWHPAERVVHFERHFLRGLKQCVHLFTVSDFVRREVIQLLNIRPERVTRTYNGIRPGLVPLPPEEVAAALRELDLPQRYLLYVGTIEPRKNVKRLLQAYCALPASVRERWPLLLVGKWGWNTADVAEYLHNEARHRGVIHRNYIDDRYLPALYNGARALVYPSLYEGFGLPPVEMMACGGAVLASTAGAVAETAGATAPLIDPLDVAGWRDALVRVVEDDDWWLSLRRHAVAASRPFTWERCAADTLRVYRQLCGEGNRLNKAA
ncbi:MAG TPA: glycosyltransferase family 1 protein [Gemmataceae bacterium]|jgi:alpha-1,3-rhamnosyl/mannosyltransferase